MAEDNKGSSVKIDIDFTAVAIFVLIIFCAGDTDLLDALIHYFMQAKA